MLWDRDVNKDFLSSVPRQKPKVFGTDNGHLRSSAFEAEKGVLTVLVAKKGTPTVFEAKKEKQKKEAPLVFEAEKEHEAMIKQQHCSGLALFLICTMNTNSKIGKRATFG